MKFVGIKKSYPDAVNNFLVPYHELEEIFNFVKFKNEKLLRGKNIFHVKCSRFCMNNERGKYTLKLRLQTKGNGPSGKTKYFPFN